MDPNIPKLEGTKQAILERLEPAEQHVLAVANGLKIRESAIRRHFDQLERAGLVKGFFRQEGLGRPKKYYGLTEWGRERFPKLYTDRLDHTIRRIISDGRATTEDQAFGILVRDRLDANRGRIQAAQSPLALARAIERAVGETGITVRGRVRGDTILFDLTSCLLLRRALHREDAADDWRADTLRSVLAQVPARPDFKIEAGEILCPAPRDGIGGVEKGAVAEVSRPPFHEGTSVEQG